MLEVRIICPKCGLINLDYFGKGSNIYGVGDLITDPLEEKTYIKEHDGRCPGCGSAFKIVEIVENFKVLNVLFNPSKPMMKKIHNGIYPRLEEYPKYDFNTRWKRLLGEDHAFIPSQLTYEFDLNINDVFCMFGRVWTVNFKYKVLNLMGMLSARIFAVTSYQDDKRLLIIRNHYLPVLKEIDWSRDDYLDDEDELRRYKIPEGYELIISY